MTKSDDGLYKMLEYHARILKEHFDSVQIFACRTIDSETTRFDHGRGSHYERLGSIRSWVDRKVESDKEEVRIRD